MSCGIDWGAASVAPEAASPSFCGATLSPSLSLSLSLSLTLTLSLSQPLTLTLSLSLTVSVSHSLSLSLSRPPVLGRVALFGAEGFHCKNLNQYLWKTKSARLSHKIEDTVQGVVRDLCEEGLARKEVS